MSNRAVILAGGKGTRLRPFTMSIPKPLAPIGDIPVCEAIIIQLANQGFSHITMAVNHQAEILMAFFGNGSKWGIKIDYSLEESPLGTMGPLLLVPDLPDQFLVLNGDVLTDISFVDFAKQHQKSEALLSVATSNHEIGVDFGVLEISNEGFLTSIQEKPKMSFSVSMGVYSLKKEALSFIQPDAMFGFDDLVKALLSKHETIESFPFDGFWLDIGRPQDYDQALDLESRGELSFFPFSIDKSKD